eukprot:13965723-Heterocapsa_arctica.AAC.1
MYRMFWDAWAHAFEHLEEGRVAQPAGRLPIWTSFQTLIAYNEAHTSLLLQGPERRDVPEEALRR